MTREKFVQASLESVANPVNIFRVAFAASLSLIGLVIAHLAFREAAIAQNPLDPEGAR